MNDRLLDVEIVAVQNNYIRFLAFFQRAEAVVHPKVFGRVHRRQGNRIRQGRPCIDHKMQERFIHCRNAAGQGTIDQAGFAVLNEHLLAA